MITIKIEEETALEMLLERCQAWGKSKNNIDLFEKMYENYLHSGVFDNCEFDVMNIVDNDVCNYCSVVEENEKDFKKLLSLYKKGECDVSCENFEEYKISFIEAVSDDETRILIRH